MLKKKRRLDDSKAVFRAAGKMELQSTEMVKAVSRAGGCGWWW